MNEAWLTHVASHWFARDFGLPITGCCLPSAWPQRPLLSAEPQTALGRAAGMDCRGMHNSADSGTAIQMESRVFHPLVCFNCVALHPLPQTMSEKTQKLEEGVCWRCFCDGADKCQHYRTSHFSACLPPLRSDSFSLKLALVTAHL